jgi:hypothetical protein
MPDSNKDRTCRPPLLIILAGLALWLHCFPAVLVAQSIPLAFTARGGFSSPLAYVGESSGGRYGFGASGMFFFHPRVAVYVGADRVTIACDVETCRNASGTLTEYGVGLHLNIDLGPANLWIQGGPARGKYHLAVTDETGSESTLDSDWSKEGLQVVGGAQWRFGWISVGPYLAYHSVWEMDRGTVNGSTLHLWPMFRQRPSLGDPSGSPYIEVSALTIGIQAGVNLGSRE